ncbi:hypothetical protein D3874_03195 [Oleomonas cavernae]|uniref:Uncharacterized protein n=1 Tax=Oleomonas cavernae TaxID=2320859 RepID=A0A418WU85_9PROT|nr:hypothetical protein [Oleomonas cavernae]RJF94834.1 hypothetical protein D3874_03195 [Oleomonas cavernae]
MNAATLIAVQSDGHVTWGLPPKGALVIASATKWVLGKNCVEACGRSRPPFSRQYDVPGVPEAKDRDEAMLAIGRWQAKIERYPGIEIYPCPYIYEGAAA